MIKTKEINKRKSNRGITLVSLIITIALMLIIASTAVYTSMDRFEINNLRKMQNDIELLEDKVSNYYFKYNVLPVIRDSSNNFIEYTHTTVDFYDKNVNDNEKYYILDLAAMEGISLNYGEKGFKNPNTTDDVYIINEGTHQIYYVKGIEMDGVIYHTISSSTDINDTISPSKPQIKVVSGTKNDEGIYITDVEVEIIPGKDNWSGIERTTYSINAGAETDITTLTNNIYTISEDGTYEIKARSYDKSGNVSEYTTKTIVIKKVSTITEEQEDNGGENLSTEENKSTIN